MYNVSFIYLNQFSLMVLLGMQDIFCIKTSLTPFWGF